MRWFIGSVANRRARLVARILVLMAVYAALAAPARGQSPRDASARPDTAQAPVVRDVTYAGNTQFSDTELNRHTRTQHNRRFLGIPGFTWWRWIYRLGDTLGGRVGRSLKSNGEAPAYLNRTILNSDAERLELFYEQQGFREARVDARIEPTDAPNRVRITFDIEPGPPTFIRTVEYEGVGHLTDEQQRRMTRASVLNPDALDPDLPARFTLERRRYAKSTLLQERQRLLTFLRNEGFAQASRDSIRALIREPEPNRLDVTFRIQTGPRYRFGDVHFSVTGLEPSARPVQDTLGVPEAVPGTRPLITARIEDERRLSSALLQRALQFEPGTTYDRSQVLATKRRLEGTGVFAFTNIAQEGVRVVPDSLPFLAHRIEARTRPRNRIRAEAFLLQRSEVVPGAENELGTGVGVTYENANLLGGGETFRIGTSGSIAANFDLSFLTSAQAEFTTSLTSPYLIRPFNWLDDALHLFDARTRLSLSLLTARRDALSLIIRGRGNARLRLEMQHTPTLTSLVDLFDVSLSNPDTLAGFGRNFLDRVIGRGDSLIITDPVQRAQILEDYTQPQINSTVRYTLRSSTTNPLRRAQGYSYEASAEVGNTLPYLLDRFAFSPDTLQNSLPGLPFLASDGDSDLIYRPYVRFVADLRQYRPLSDGTVLALKFIGGVAHPTGRPDVVPFDRRFYSGGASSVRGWSLRELGPGRAALDTAATGGSGTTNILGGDVKLEASAELRTTLLRNVLATNWLGAVFVDAGNVWFGPRNPGSDAGRFSAPDFLTEVGVGSGVGIRLSWDYLVARLDLAYRLYDPLPQNQGLFEDGSAGPQLHFGIGHTF